MGTGINTFLANIKNNKGYNYNKSLENFRDKTIGLDCGYLYKWIQKSSTLSEYQSFIKSFINKFNNFNIKLCFIFDGRYDSEKACTIENRQKKRQKFQEKLEDLPKTIENQHQISCLEKKANVCIQKIHISLCKEILDEMGVLYIHIKSLEADSLFRYLIDTGIIYAILSEDSDCLAYKCERMLFGLDYLKDTVNQYTLSKILEELNITYFQFLDAFIASGTSYNKCLKYSCKFKDNLELVRRFGNLESILDNLPSINSGKTEKLIAAPDNFHYENIINLYTKDLPENVKTDIDDCIYKHLET